MKLKILFVCLFTLSCKRVDDHSSTKTYREVVATHWDEYVHPERSIVAIETGGSGYIGCSGSFITKEWILTAAHCQSDGSRFAVNVPQLRRGAGTPIKELDECDPFSAPRPSDWRGILMQYHIFDQLDVQLMKVFWYPGKEIPIKPFKLISDESVVKKGDWIQAIGYLRWVAGVLIKSFGNVLSTSHIWNLNPNQSYLAYDATQGNQMSGGPVIKHNTDILVGVISGSYKQEVERGNPDLNVHSYATYIPNLLNKNKWLIEFLFSNSIEKEKYLNRYGDLPRYIEKNSSSDGSFLIDWDKVSHYDFNKKCI